MLAAGHRCGVADPPPAEHIHGIDPPRLVWFGESAAAHRSQQRTSARAWRVGVDLWEFGERKKKEGQKVEGQHASHSTGYTEHHVAVPEAAT